MPRRWRDERFRTASVLAVLVLFVVCGLVRYWNAQGDDLSSSYVGCRLIATGNASHLYTYDPNNFAAIGPDDPWQAAADWGEFDSFLHPYVQTPLWAYILQPVCGTKFATFEHLFAIAMLLSFAGCIWLVARYWIPRFLTPQAMAATLLLLWFSEPFRYAMTLMQTHILFLLLTVAALMLAERNKPGWAGLLLACAAAVKITPGFLVLYWLLTRRWKAAASMALWSAALAAVTVVTTGWPLMLVYLADLQRISRLLLVAFNNQSLAAWWMGRYYPGEVDQFHMLPLPALVRVGSLLLMVGLTAVGAMIDRRRETRPHTHTFAIEPPLGALIALIAGTVCAPIAWTHYAILLVLPLMALWQEGRTLRNGWIMAAGFLIAALNIRPLAMNIVDERQGRLTIMRSEFYAQALCMATLAVVAWLRSKQTGNAIARRAEYSLTKEFAEQPLA